MLVELGIGGQVIDPEETGLDLGDLLVNLV
jgi:hypothetical protein